MFTKKRINIPCNDELNVIGGDVVDTDRYVCPNLTNMYIRSALNMPIFNLNSLCYYKQLINHIPYKSATEFVLHCSIYAGTLLVEVPIVAYSHNMAYTSLIGMKLSESSKCSLVDFTNRVITTNTTIKESCLFNSHIPMHVENKAASDEGTEFTYFENCIFQQFVNVKHTTIIHPLIVSRFKSIYQYLDVSGNEEIKFDISCTSGNLASITYITLKPLKLLFSGDGVVWYTYDTGSSSFVLAESAGAYFTYNEMYTLGTKYTDYLQIPFAKFEGAFSTRELKGLFVLSNNWILPRYVKQSRFKESLDSTQFIYASNTGVRTIVYSGTV